MSLSAESANPVLVAEPDLPAEAPRAPTEEEWDAMTPAQQERCIERLLASDTQEDRDERDAMAEGDPHLDAKNEVRDTLKRFFRGIERSIYVGADIKVFYPGHKGFTPDLIAVADATPDNRDCWMVRKEGKGVDLAMEIHYKGDWRKDFIDNVEKYAELGISEYFAFDLRRQRLLGYRLPRPGGRKYSPLRAVRGRLRSQVLGLELVAEDGGLRFYHGTARLFHLEQMLDQAEARAEQANERAEQANERAEQAVRRLQEAVLNAMRMRGLMVSEELAARVRDTSDLDQLDQLLQRALTVAGADEMLLP